MKTIKLKIQSRDDRDKMIIALVNNGYAVWVEEKRKYTSDAFPEKYYVCFKTNESEVRGE